MTDTKKAIICLLVLILTCCMTVVLCTSCSAEGGAGNETEDSEEPEQGESDVQTDDSGSDADGGAESGTDDIDVDLTVLSSTMVYSEVSDMMTSPENYIGKQVRMSGAFAVYHDENTDKYYFACIIQDATACCSQGIEFVLKGDVAYPDDYPEIGEEITVEGTFDTYDEGGNRYCTLRNAEIV